MTDDEWGTISLVLSKGFPGEFDEGSELAYRTMLGDEDPAALLLAVKTIGVRTGATFRPSVSEVLHEIHPIGGPGAEEAHRVLYGPGGIAFAQVPSRAGIWQPGQRDRETRDLRRELVEAADPKLRAFVLDQGLDYLVLDRPVTDDEDGHNGARRHRFDEAWADFTERWKHGEARAIASGQRRSELQRGERNGLKRLGAG